MIKVLLSSEKMPILSAKLREYLSTGFEESAALAAAMPKRAQFDMQESDLFFDGEDGQEYIVHFSKNPDLTNGACRYVKSGENPRKVRFGTLLPGTTYYAKIVNAQDESDCTEIFSFATEDCIVRPLYVLDADGYGPRNVRDIGGYTVRGGGKIRYEKMYRGTLLNNCWNDNYQTTDGVRKILKDELGIVAEIDLRMHGVDDVNVVEEIKIPQTVNELDEQLPYYKLAIEGYAVAFTDENSIKNIPQIFRALTNENNYPVYLHCIAGADRTGTFVFLLHLLLGVDYEDALRQYEMTSFSPQGPRLRVNNPDPVVHFDKFTAKLLELYGNGSDDLNAAVERYVLSLGVTKDEIDTIRRIFIQD